MDVALLSTKELISILQTKDHCSACRYEAANKITKITDEKQWVTESIINKADEILSISKPLHDFKNKCLADKPSELCPKCLTIVDIVPLKRVGLKCKCQQCGTELVWAIKWANKRYMSQLSMHKAFFYLTDRSV
jgi:hypothetical protein